jgi:hypothetical protein
MGRPATAGTISTSHLTNPTIFRYFLSGRKYYFCAKDGGNGAPGFETLHGFAGLAAIPSARDGRRYALTVGRAIRRVRYPPGLRSE